MKEEKEIKKLHLPQYDEIYEKVYRRLGRILGRREGVNPQAKADQILDTTYNILTTKLDTYSMFYRLVRRNERYKTYLIMVLGEASIEHLREIAYLKNRVRMIYRMGKRHVRFSSNKEKIREALRFSARMLSIVKRHRKSLREAVEIKKEVLRLPGLDEMPAIVIAGAPNVGKSTLMKRIAKSRTITGDYPYTTKKAVPGKLLAEEKATVIVVDTPGITGLDDRKTNIIERRALAVLRMPGTIVLFLIDPDPNSFLSLDKQLELLEKTRLYNYRVIPVINKIDLYPEEAKKVSTILQERGWGRVFEISALSGEGLKDLIEELSRILRETVLQTIRQRGKRGLGFDGE